jgi:hypothetical protein
MMSAAELSDALRALSPDAFERLVRLTPEVKSATIHFMRYGSRTRNPGLDKALAVMIGLGRLRAEQAAA